MFLYLLYFVTRLINLDKLPIFNDEAFFIHAARQIISNPLQNLFFNFSDGKEPFFFWLYTLPVKFSSDALLGIRLFTVILGFLTLIYLLKISQKLSLNSFWIGLAYVVSPFLLFYHRIAMQETLLTFLLVAGIYYLLSKNQILTGIFLGLALLTKTSSLAFLIFLFPILIYRKYFFTLIIAGLIYLPVFIGFSQISAHNSSYFGLISLSQIIINLKMATKWLWEYQGPLGLLGILMPPVILESFIAKIFFPRYFLFVIPLIILFAAKILKNKPWLFFLLLVPNIILSFQIVSDVKFAPLPYIEKWQYLEAWPAGEGIKETAAFLRSQNAKVVVTEDIMIARNGLEYYYPQAIYKTNGTGSYYVFVREHNPKNEMILKYSYQDKIKVYQ
mgnify:FL=1